MSDSKKDSREITEKDILEVLASLVKAVEELRRRVQELEDTCVRKIEP